MKKLLALLFAFMLIFTACGQSEDEPADVTDTPSTEQEQPEEPNEPEKTEEPEEPEEPEVEPDLFVASGNINPLTGLCDGISDEALTRKPVAIMVSNSYDSLPQWGITQPDIIYEMLAEGRITRLLAIFKDPSKIDHLASVRSARPYFIDMAQSYGAVYMHFGGSVPAYDAIKARGDLIALDGIRGGWEGSLYHRDPDRKKNIGYEHSVYTTGGDVEAALASLNKDLSQDTQPSAFNFSESLTKNSASEGTPMSKVTVTFSSRNMPWFEYNAENDTYLRYQYDDPHMDAWLDKQIEVKNLFVLRMPMRDLGGDLKLVEVDTTGTGEGYYFCGGKYVPITWQKDAYNAPITFYDANGSELSVARGQTFISVVTETASVDIE